MTHRHNICLTDKEETILQAIARANHRGNISAAIGILITKEATRLRRKNTTKVGRR